jgi:hypothetical protein
MTVLWRKLARSVFFVLISLLVAGSLLANPTARTGASLVYADHLQRGVLFGGLTDPDSASIRYELGDTWEWTGTRWIQIFPAQSPPARSGSGMAYDSARRQVILFGGLQGRDDFFADTWAYRDRTWVGISPPSSPPPRTFPAMAYDPLRDRVVLHGGADGSGPLGDTWEFDGTTWTQRAESGPALSGASLVYDAARNRILLLGMTTDTPGLPEMYGWTGTSWDRITPANIPPCVGFGAMVYQEHNQRVLFLGGQCGNGFSESATWEWDGQDWTDVEPTINPGDIVAPAVAYDKARKNVVAFGGDSGFGVTATTFLFADGTWRPLVDQSTPGARSLHVFEYDPVRNVSWLFGGRSAPGGWSDLWKLSDNIWEQVIAPDSPTACFEPAGAWDTDRNKLVVVCSSTAVHEWDGERWQSFSSLSEQPQTRRWSSLVYDPKSKTSILFGGYTDANTYTRETWAWNGSRWTQLAKDKTSPSSRALASVFYDASSDRVLLFGGIGRNSLTAPVQRHGDMWAWDGQNWTEIKTASLPPARYGAKTALNVQDKSTLLFGGKSDQEKYLDDQWEWNGSTWRQLSPAGTPAPRMNHGILYDQFLERFVMYGGYAGLYFAELWRFDGASWIVQQPSTGRRRGVVLSRPAGTSGIAAARGDE